MTVRDDRRESPVVEGGDMTTFRLAPDLRHALKERAKAEGRSTSGVLRSLVREYVSSPPLDERPQEVAC